MSSSERLCQAASNLNAHSLALRLEQAGTEPGCKQQQATGDSSTSHHQELEQGKGAGSDSPTPPQRCGMLMQPR